MPESTEAVPPPPECPGCAATIEPAADTVVVDGVPVCPTCAVATSACARCGGHQFPDELTVVVAGDEVCASCLDWGFTHCSWCERHEHDGHLGETRGGDVVCRDCAARHYYLCGDCDYLYHVDTCCDCDHRDYSDDDDDDGGDYGSAGLIHSYSHKPRPIFHGAGTVHFGLELEINTPRYEQDACAITASEALGSLGYLKHDSSISRGFEIVTHPMSHAWARASFPWHMLADLARLGCDGDDAGLHIHVSRTAFDGPAHVYRWLKLFHRNVTPVTAIARRVSDQWAPFTPDARTRAKDHAKGRPGYESRYAAINVTNYATFELRIFASTLDPQQLAAALDLAAASVEYTRELSTADIATRDGWSWGAFMTWAARRPAYLALVHENALVRENDEVHA